MTSPVREHIQGNVVGYVAIMIAVIGVPTTWAVTRNSVGSAQIKKNAVKNSDVADNAIGAAEVIDDSLGGQDIAETALGQVPSAQSAATAGNADTLDNFNSTDFLASGATAGGDLGGPFSSLQIGANAVGTNEVDGSLTGADIANAPSGSDNVNADLLDGLNSDSLLRESANNSSTSPDTVQTPTFFSYLANTGSANTFEFRDIEVRTTGVAGQFKICSDGGNQAPIVVYRAGARAAETTEPNDACGTAFALGLGVDFQIVGAGVIVWGISDSINLPASPSWQLLGFDASGL